MLPSQIQQSPYPRMDNAVGKSDRNIPKFQLQMCFSNLLSGNILLHPRDEHALSVAQQNNCRIIKLHQIRIALMIHLHHSKGRIRHLAYLTDRERRSNRIHDILELSARRYHGGDDLAGQSGQNICLYAGAQTIRQYQ